MSYSQLRRFAIIVPACNEEACLAPVLAELRGQLDPAQFPVVVGVNGSTDRTAEIAREQGAHVAEVRARGYGYGCQAAVELAEVELGPVHGYVFVAADGANDPRDVPALVAEFERGARMVLGCRTTRPRNWSPVTFPHVVANLALGFFCGCLPGASFATSARCA